MATVSYETFAVEGSAMLIWRLSERMCEWVYEYLRAMNDCGGMMWCC